MTDPLLRTTVLSVLLLAPCSAVHAQNVDEDNGWSGSYVSSIGATGSDFYAQSFRANVPTITKFGVVIQEIEAQGELVLAIAADNGSGAPDVNAPLYRGTLRNPSTTGAWFFETGIDVPVVVGRKYWILIDGYDNPGATGRSAIGTSNGYTDTGEAMIYSNSGGVGAWSSIPTMRLAIYVEGENAQTVDESNGWNGNYVSSIGAIGSNFYAQSFRANVATITRFGVVIREIDAGGEVALAIAADNGSGAPDVNAPLYRGALKNPSTTDAWFYERGINVPVTIGQKYWILIDGYDNPGATGRSAIGASNGYTDTGEGMIYSNSGGIGAWSSISSLPLAVYVEGEREQTVDEDNGWNGSQVASIGETGSDFYAQSFLANVATITDFGVVLQELDAEGELVLAIAADNGSGQPDVNAPLYRGALRNPSATPAWFYQQGLDVPVTIGQKYWVVVDGYNNTGATGRSAIGLSDSPTDTGEAMIYSNSGGTSWSSLGSISAAIYVAGRLPATATVTGGGAICPGQTAEVRATLTGMPPWALTWSDGLVQPGILASPVVRSVSPSSTTTYGVTAVSDASGPGSASGSATVTVNEIPATPVPTNDGPKCEGGAVQLTVGTVVGATYAWTGPGGFTSTQQLPTLASVTTAMAGDYSVTVSVGGCTSAPGTTTVVVHARPAAPAITVPAEVLSETAGYAASVAPGAGAQYAWTISNGAITAGAGTSSVTFSSGTPGTMTLSVVVTTSAGCASPVGSATVAVRPIELYTVVPCRVIDTRTASAPHLGALERRNFPVAGSCGIPSTAKAAVLNVTVADTEAAGYLTLFPGDLAVPPAVSTVNFRKRQVKANNGIVSLGLDGSLGISNGAGAAVNVLVDVSGYFQ